MKIAEESGAWKVLVGGPLGVYLITETDQATLGVVPADNGLYLYANIPSAGLGTITVLFDSGTSYTLVIQIGSGTPTYRMLIDASESRAFIHALTAGRTAEIIAGPDTYPVSLAGTSPGVDSLNFYGKEHDLRLPPPFTPAREYRQAIVQAPAAASTSQPQPAPPTSESATAAAQPQQPSVGRSASQSSAAPADISTQWDEANRDHCDLQHTALACTQYNQDSLKCLNIAQIASVIVQIERPLLRQGEAPQQAARFAAEQTGYGDLAVSALSVPAAMTPNEFSNWVMKGCLERIAQ